MKRGHGLICTVLVLGLTLTGCASIPDLSKEDQKQVTEYAASLMLKYDSENHSRLVDVKDFITRYETATRMYNQAEEAYYAAIEAEKEQRIAETEEQERLNEEYAKNTTPTVDISEGGSGSGSGSGQRMYDNMSLGEFLGLPELNIVYAGSDTMMEYPESDDEIQLSLDASKGNQLLVMYFTVTNTSADIVDVDILSALPTFKISVNGDIFYSTLKTLLDDDLSVYVGSFAPGETKCLVLVKEIREGIRVSTLDMRVSQGKDSLTQSLQ